MRYIDLKVQFRIYSLVPNARFQLDRNIVTAMPSSLTTTAAATIVPSRCRCLHTIVVFIFAGGTAQGRQAARRRPLGALLAGSSDLLSPPGPASPGARWKCPWRSQQRRTGDRRRWEWRRFEWGRRAWDRRVWRWRRQVGPLDGTVGRGKSGQGQAQTIHQEAAPLAENSPRAAAEAQRKAQGQARGGPAGSRGTGSQTWAKRARREKGL